MGHTDTSGNPDPVLNEKKGSGVSGVGVQVSPPTLVPVRWWTWDLLGTRGHDPLGGVSTLFVPEVIGLWGLWGGGGRSLPPPEGHPSWKDPGPSTDGGRFQFSRW